MTPSEIAAWQQMKEVLWGANPETVASQPVFEQEQNINNVQDDLTAEMMRLAWMNQEQAPAPIVQPKVIVQPEVTPQPVAVEPEPPVAPVNTIEPSPVEVDSDMEKLLDELIEEQNNKEEEQNNKEEEDNKEEEKELDNSKKESIIDEEMLVENKTLRDKLRSIEEDKSRYENQSQQRKTKAEEALFELENSKLQLKTWANIPLELKEFAQDFSKREEAESPTILDKRNVLIQIGKIYKQVTGYNIDDTINSHLQSSDKSVTPSWWSPMSGWFDSQKKSPDYIQSIF